MKKVLSAVLMAFFLFLGTNVAQAEEFENPPIINGAKLLEKGRYRSPENYNDTLSTYRKMLRNHNATGYRWHTIVHQNNIKAKFLENTHKKSKWAGLNIYEHNGETRIFVVPR